MTDTIPPPAPPAVRYRCVRSADELPDELRDRVLTIPNHRTGEPFPAWRVQPNPPHPDIDGRFPDDRPKPGDLDKRGNLLVWPDLFSYAEPDDDIEPCPSCTLRHYTYEGHPSCEMHNVMGHPCRQRRIAGSRRCRIHSNPSEQQSHRQRLARDEIVRSIADVEVEDLGNPIDRLAELAQEQLAWKDHLASIVAALRDRYRFTDEKGAEHLDARVDLYTKALKECQRQLDALVKIGFEEKRLALEEKRVALVAEFATQLLQALGHDPADPDVRTEIERFLPILDGEAPPEAITA